MGGRRSGDQQVVGLLGTAAGQHGGRRGWGWDRRSPRYRCLGFWLLRRLRQHRASSTSLRSGKEEGRKGGRKEEGNRGRKKEGREGGRAGGGERGDSPSTSTEHVCSEAPSDLSFKRLSGLQRGGGLVAAGPGPCRGLPTPEITLVPLVPQPCVVRAKGRLSRWGGPAEWGCRAGVQSRRPGVLGVYPTQLLQDESPAALAPPAPPRSCPGTEAQRGEGPARPRSREAPVRLLIHMDEGPGLHAGRPLAASTPPRAAEHLLALEGCRSSTLERNPPWCMAGSARIKDRKKENEAFLVKTEARSSCDIRASGGLRQRRGGAKAARVGLRGPTRVPTARCS